MGNSYANYLKTEIEKRGYAQPELLKSVADTTIGWSEDELLLSGAVKPLQLLQLKSDYFGIPYTTLDGFLVPAELFRIIGIEQCYKSRILPYSLENETLHIVIVDPLDVSLPQRIESKYGYQVAILLSMNVFLEAALKRSEGEVEKLRDVSDNLRRVGNDEGIQERTESKADKDYEESLSPVVKFINTLLSAAITKRASDIHIEPQEVGVLFKYRIDGVMYPATEILDMTHHSAVVTRLKVMAELDIAERRVPQDGKFRLDMFGREIDFRLSILPAVFGEDIVIRVLDKSSITEDFKDIRLERLGMSSDVLMKFRRSVREPYGMVLMTGPTGSGKTTTLYAALAEINNGEEKIITIEDPVEYQLDGIIQIPVNEKKGLTFARGLRSILRHDPDKIMVGEIRDAETASIAVQSALTGHLVFTTVHANNVFDVVGRFYHMGIDIYSFVSSLNCVMAQRLIRLTCPYCKSEIDVTSEYLELSALDPHLYRDQKWFHGVGCERCNGTGYRGRAAVTELLTLTPAIRQMFIEQRSLSEIKDVALKNGLETLRQSAIAKALSGETTLKEINRVTFVD